MSKSRNSITAEQCRAMGYCPSCGNPIADGVDCCGNIPQSRFDAMPSRGSAPTRIDTGAARQNAPRRVEMPKERATRKTTKAEDAALRHLKSVYTATRWESHGMTLRFPDGDRYTPDIVGYPGFDFDRIKLIEVKGGYRGPGWEQGHERFKRAKERWGDDYDFVMLHVKRGEVQE